MVDLNSLKHDISIYVRAMDDVLEENIPNHPLEEQRESARTFRNLGIGVMGIHDMFIKMGIVYGSDESIRFLSKLMSTIFRTSVQASVKLAKERGSFPGYDPKVWDATIIKKNFSEHEIEELKRSNCLRNCSLLSVAPTGLTIGSV